MYTEKNYKTKKEFMADYKNGVDIYVYQPNAIFPVSGNGRVSIEGPHYPLPHKWYCSAIIKDFKIMEVK